MSQERPEKIAVLGAGTMGAGIALSFAQAGYGIKLIDASETALERAEVAIGNNIKQLAEYGLVNGSVDTNLARITFSNDIGLLSSERQLKLVVESIPEVLELKRELFASLDSLDDAVILASNTSSFTMSEITDGMGSAQRTVGLHYFNPPHIIPAVEVHRCGATTRETIDATRAIVESTGKVSIIVRKEMPGFVINRLTGALEREIDYLLDEGVVSPDDLDRAVKASLGFRLACLGPMEAEDMIGLDIAARVSANLFQQLSNASVPSPGILEKVERGELGVKAGRGWYDYPEERVDSIIGEKNDRLLRQLALYRRVSGAGEDQ